MLKWTDIKKGDYVLFKFNNDIIINYITNISQANAHQGHRVIGDDIYASDIYMQLEQDLSYSVSSDSEIIIYVKQNFGIRDDELAISYFENHYPEYFL